jgi:hypothetical protein
MEEEFETEFENVGGMFGISLPVDKIPPEFIFVREGDQTVPLETFLNPERSPELSDGGTEKKVAGIDLRTLAASAPMVTRAQASVVQRAVPEAELKQQWQGIMEECRKKAMPYDKISAYVAQCKSQNAGELVAPVVDYIAGLMRVEESYGISSSPQMIQALSLTQSEA